MKFQDDIWNMNTHTHTDKPKPICPPLFQSWGHKNLFLIVTRIVRGSDYSPTIALSEDKDIQGHYYFLKTDGA